MPIGTCTETTDDHGKATCGKPITTEVSWPDPNTSYRTTVVLQVCDSCANDYMTWRADWLNPTRKPISM